MRPCQTGRKRRSVGGSASKQSFRPGRGSRNNLCLDHQPRFHYSDGLRCYATYQYFVIGFFQTTNSFTNQLTGYPNTPVDIAPGTTQSFVIGFTPIQPFDPVDAQMSFYCANTAPAPIITGLDTLLLSASAAPVPDILALAVTPTNDGIVNIPGMEGTGAFSVSTVNVGASGSITVSADTGNAILPVDVFLCETDPTNGQCISAISANVTTQINADATPTFAVFAHGSGNVPFAPAAARIFVRFKDSEAVIRGLTSVAVRTQ